VVAFAHAGFDTLTGTGVLGVGQMQPPGLDQPLTELIATGKHVTRYEWTCTRREAAGAKVKNGWWWTITQDARTLWDDFCLVAGWTMDVTVEDVAFSY
jgi:hypothetical protein